MKSLEELVKSFGGSEKLVKRTIDKYLEFIPVEHGALEDALNRGDAAVAGAKAHSIKGFMGYFVDDETYSLTARLEKAARNGEFEEAQRLNSEFSKRLDLLKLELEEILGALG